MLDRGTKKHDANDIAAQLDRVGATIDFDSESGLVTFEARCLKKDMPLVVSLLAEQLREPSFPADEFEKLKTQELAEAEQLRESTDQQATIAFTQAVFAAGHPYRRLTPDETIAAVEKATLEEVKSFHARSFGPAHCTLVVVGDADVPQIQAEVKKAFAGWQGGQPRPKPGAAKPLEKAVELPVQVVGKTSISVVIGQPGGLTYMDEDHLPLALATSTLGYGFTSRLVGTVRDTEGLTYGIMASLAGRGPYDRAWAIRATFAPSLLSKGLASTRRELEKWHSEGITAAELEYRKGAMAGAHQVRLATSRGLAAAILEVVERGMEPSWIDEYPAKIKALSLDQVNEALRRRLSADKMITIKAGSLEVK
jgi:zinc protease